MAEKSWYIIRTKSGDENKVKLALDAALDSAGLRDRVTEVLVPTEDVVEVRSGKRYRSEKKFFPGYILVHMEMDESIWYFIRQIPRVFGFLGGAKPAPIRDQEAELILGRIRASEGKPRPKILFQVGEMVRVVQGPFTDFSGTIEEVNYEKNRVRVAVLIFGRSTPVELEFDQISKT